MWLKKNPWWLTALLYTTAGLVVSVTVSLLGWTAGEALRPACRDTIVAVEGRPTGSPCDDRQSLQFLRDFNGDRYIMCRCPGHAPQQDTLVPLLPYLSTPKEPDYHVVPEPEGEEQEGTYL